MTDNEIIKALECCSQNGDFTKTQIEICSPCPYVNCGDCTGLLKADALDLINRQKELIEKSERVEHFADKTIKAQKAEIDKYAEEQHELMIEKDKLFDIAEKQKAEIERLKTEKDNLIRTYAECQAEAVKEFAEMLKENFKPLNSPLIENRIDNLLKETVGGNQ